METKKKTAYLVQDGNITTRYRDRNKNNDRQNKTQTNLLALRILWLPGKVVEAAIFKEEVQEFGKKRHYRDKSTKVYKVVIEQFYEAIKVKREAGEHWRDINREHNRVRLFKAVKSLMHNQMQNDVHPRLTAYESIGALINIRQQRYKETAQ